MQEDTTRALTHPRVRRRHTHGRLGKDLDRRRLAGSSHSHDFYWYSGVLARRRARNAAVPAAAEAEPVQR